MFLGGVSMHPIEPGGGGPKSPQPCLDLKVRNLRQGLDSVSKNTKVYACMMYICMYIYIYNMSANATPTTKTNLPLKCCVFLGGGYQILYIHIYI